MIGKIPPELFEIMKFGSIIIFGAIAHATAQLKIARDNKQEFTVADFFILSVLGAFSGIMFGLLATSVFDDQTMVFLFTGMGSFMGVAGLNWLSVWALNKLGVKKDNEK